MVADQMSSGRSGNWTHSFEEDEGDVQVCRLSGSFAFPPSRRGRETLDFSQSGQVDSGMPGADDKRQHSTSSVVPMVMNRFRIGEGRVIEVIESGPDVLKVKPA
jgi:hypothetical protein